MRLEHLLSGVDGTFKSRIWNTNDELFYDLLLFFVFLRYKARKMKPGYLRAQVLDRASPELLRLDSPIAQLVRAPH